MEGEEYLGATGLHLAIAYGNDEVAEMLILAGGVSDLVLRSLTLGCPIKQKDFSCFWSHSYPGWFLSRMNGCDC